MRTIQRTISLEPFTSRLPSIWPAYLDNTLYYFDEDSLKERGYEHTSNYGMVPLNISVSPKPGEGKEYSIGCDFTLSWYTLNKWYHFFTEYYNLLRQYGHCNRVYTSAEEYYNYESLDKYADQMIYGTDKQAYLDLDAEFANMGGVVSVQWITLEEAHDENDDDKMVMTDVKDDGFFKWICENVVPSFDIPMEYVDYWNTKKLFYPDVVKWMAWFKEREGYETEAEFKQGEDGEVDTWNCKKTTDCCDCEEYFKRGGARMCDLMVAWYNSVKVLTKDDVLDEKGEMKKCYQPNMIIPTELQLSIDDLGQQSIFSSEYKLGIDYRTSTMTTLAEGNEKSGTVVTMDGKSMILTGNSKGFEFDEKYMEKYVSVCNNENCGYQGVFVDRCPKCGSRNVTVNGWTSYTEYHLDGKWIDNIGGPNEEDEKFRKELREELKQRFYVDDVKFFAFDENNVKYTSSIELKERAKDELKEKMSKKYEMTTSENGWYLINGTLYDINITEYGIYDESNKYLGGRKYMVHREKGTNTPYTVINGKNVYAEFYLPRNKFYFPFFKKPKIYVSDAFNINDYWTFDRLHTSTYIMRYIEYGGKAISIKDIKNNLVDGYLAYRIKGYAVTEEGETLYWVFNKKTDKENESEDNTEEMTEDETLPSVIKVTLEGLIEDCSDTVKTEKDGDGNQYFIVKYDKEFTVYSINEITGITYSKIEDLRSYNTLVDDIGNTIDAIRPKLTEEQKNLQPTQGEELEPLYQVGNTANINKFSGTMEDMDKIMYESDNTSRNYFVGDIITEMSFYYKDANNESVEETRCTVILTPLDEIEVKYYELEFNDGGITSVETSETISSSTVHTSLMAVKKSTEKKEFLVENNNCEEDEDEEKEIRCLQFIDDVVFCDVTYYKGATLSRLDGKGYNLAQESRSDNYSNYGVQYKETVRFIKEDRQYYLEKPKKIDLLAPFRRKKVESHSISYPVCVYRMVQEETEVEASQYETPYSLPMAEFKFNIDIIKDGKDDFSTIYGNEMEKFNGMEIFPTMKEEYRLGSSMIENVDSDIYIERGINAAFEKHLKLGEVTSLESLEQLGNGYFKMMDS